MLLKVRNRDDKQPRGMTQNSFRYACFALFLITATFLTISGQSSAQAPTDEFPCISCARQMLIHKLQLPLIPIHSRPALD